MSTNIFKRLGPIQNTPLLHRAFKAWFRYAEKEGIVPDQPSLYHSDTWTDEQFARHYVVVANGKGILAIFRALENEGNDKLKRLKRWPQPLIEMYN
jgi:hypothetical protein